VCTPSFIRPSTKFGKLATTPRLTSPLLRTHKSLKSIKQYYRSLRPQPPPTLPDQYFYSRVSPNLGVFFFHQSSDALLASYKARVSQASLHISQLSRLLHNTTLRSVIPASRFTLLISNHRFSQLSIRHRSREFLTTRSYIVCTLEFTYLLSTRSEWLAPSSALPCHFTEPQVVSLLQSVYSLVVNTLADVRPANADAELIQAAAAEEVAIEKASAEQTAQMVAQKTSAEARADSKYISPSSLWQQQQCSTKLERSL
jgi:hypothetical protein